MLEYDLIPSFNQGDGKAFKVVFDTYYPRLMVFALKLINDKTEAEDIILPVFQSVFSKCNSFESIIKIQAFLYVSVRNRCLNHIKLIQKTNRFKSKFIEEVQNDELFELSYSVRDEVIIRIHKLIEELPSECGRIFKMLFFDQLEPIEIANKLNIERQTVYVQKNRALNFLKMKLLNTP
jgi:RNA polymerase sigma-70 factor (ECF subfamily)